VRIDVRRAEVTGVLRASRGLVMPARAPLGTPVTLRRQSSPESRELDSDSGRSFVSLSLETSGVIVSCPHTHRPLVRASQEDFELIQATVREVGGLADRQRECTRGGVPVLSSIPLLGGLFARASRRATETELFPFLTPRVIRDDTDAERLTKLLQERAETHRP